MRQRSFNTLQGEERELKKILEPGATSWEENSFSDFRDAALWKLAVLLLNRERNWASHVIKRPTPVPAAFLGNNCPVTFPDPLQCVPATVPRAFRG